VFDDGLETAGDHALRVEGHVVHAVVVQARVGHHLRHDRVARLPVGVDDEGEHDDLVLLGLHRAGERCQFAHRYVVADALEIGQRAVLHPDVAPRPGHLLVGLERRLRHRDHKTIDIGHDLLLMRPWVRLTSIPTQPTKLS